MSHKHKMYTDKIFEIDNIYSQLFSLWKFLDRNNKFLQFENVFKTFLIVKTPRQFQDQNSLLQEHNRLLRAQNLLLKRQNRILQDKIKEFQQTKVELRKKNEQLHRQANIDGLTQVSNRRCFDEYFAQEWQRCKQQQQPLSLIMIDIDYFKRYNDAYGHQAGDKCLFRVAQGMIRMVKRSRDLVTRYGGEEFAIILPNTDQAGAMELAESIRQEIAQLYITHAQSEVQDYLTLSLGISSSIPTQALSPAELIKTADQALYDAKEQGRDRIVAYH